MYKRNMVREVLSLLFWIVAAFTATYFKVYMYTIISVLLVIVQIESVVCLKMEYKKELTE